MKFLASPSSWASSVSCQVMNSLAMSACWGPGRDGDDVATNEGRLIPVLDARQRRNAEVEFRMVLLDRVDHQTAGTLHAKLAAEEHGDEVVARIGLCIGRNGTCGPHIVERGQHFLDARAFKDRIVRFLGQKLGTRAPHHGRNGEDVAATAESRRNNSRMCHRQARRSWRHSPRLRRGSWAGPRWSRTGLTEQVLVVDQDRHVRCEAGAVQLAVIGGQILERLGNLGLVGIVFREGRSGPQEACPHDNRA